jgi:hypothetical protein
VWRPDPENYDATKVNGLTFPKVIRSSKFAASRDIEGPIWKLMYQERKNNWMRKLANGREMYLRPVGDVGTAVFISEMLQEIISKGLNVDAIYAPISSGGWAHHG